MNFKKKSTTIRLLTCALTLCIILGATFIGIYSAPSDQPSSTPPINKSPVYDDRIPPQGSTATHNTDHAAKTELPDSGEAPDGKANVETIPVDLETVAFGDTIKLGDYTLSDGDKIYYDISAESGNGIEIFFAKYNEKNTFYWFVHNLRQPDEPLKCSVDFTVKPPANPGTYQLFLRPVNGALENVTGSISITSADAD